MIYVSNSLLRRVFITYVYRCNCCLLFIGRHFHYVILRMVDILAVTATQSIVKSDSQNWCLILDTPHSTGFWENVYKRRRDKGIIYWSTRGFHWSTGLGVYPDHVNTHFFQSLLAKKKKHNRRLWSELNSNLNFVVSQQKPCICLVVLDCLLIPLLHPTKTCGFVRAEERNLEQDYEAHGEIVWPACRRGPCLLTQQNQYRNDYKTAIMSTPEYFHETGLIHWGLYRWNSSGVAIIHSPEYHLWMSVSHPFWGVPKSWGFPNSWIVYNGNSY